MAIADQALRHVADSLEASQPTAPAEPRLRITVWASAEARAGVLPARAPAVTSANPQFTGTRGRIQRQAGLADVDLEDLPRVRVVAGLEVAVRDEQRVAEEREAPRRVEARIRDPPDLVAGRVEDRDLVRARAG